MTDIFSMWGPCRNPTHNPGCILAKYVYLAWRIVLQCHWSAVLAGDQSWGVDPDLLQPLESFSWSLVSWVLTSSSSRGRWGGLMLCWSLYVLFCPHVFRSARGPCLYRVCGDRTCPAWCLSCGSTREDRVLLEDWSVQLCSPGSYSTRPGLFNYWSMALQNCCSFFSTQ